MHTALWLGSKIEFGFELGLWLVMWLWLGLGLELVFFFFMVGFGSRVRVLSPLKIYRQVNIIYLAHRSTRGGLGHAGSTASFIQLLLDFR